MDPRSQPADGFTIVEVVVAITVLVVAMLGAALLFENAIVVSGNTRNRVVAANLATQQMENVRGLAADPTKFTTIPQGQTVFAGPGPEGERHPVHRHPERAVRRPELVDELV